MVLQHLLLLLGVAMLTIEAVDSQLAISIKKLLKIDRKRSGLRAASSWKFYRRVLPEWLLGLVAVLIIPLIILSKFLSFFIELIGCIYCLSFWAGATFSFLFVGTDIISSAIYGGITIIFTRIIDKNLCL